MNWTPQKVQEVLSEVNNALSDLAPGYGYKEPEKNLAVSVTASAILYAATNVPLLERTAERLNQKAATL